jgi:hypothetical protein
MGSVPASTPGDVDKAEAAAKLLLAFGPRESDFHVY